MSTADRTTLTKNLNTVTTEITAVWSSRGVATKPTKADLEKEGRGEREQEEGMWIKTHPGHNPHPGCWEIKIGKSKLEVIRVVLRWDLSYVVSGTGHGL